MSGAVNLIQCTFLTHQKSCLLIVLITKAKKLSIYCAVNLLVIDYLSKIPLALKVIEYQLDFCACPKITWGASIYVPKLLG